jgi:hypothetical protein
MQRVILWLSALLALYVSGFACATDEVLPPAAERPIPHIALLLPLKSAVFGTAADAIQQGFLAANGVEITNPQNLPVRVYGSFDEANDIITLYRRAIAEGARAVVGPLTRSGVALLAVEPVIPVPTLALNIADVQPAEKLYFFGIAVEAEARQVAQLARQDGFRQAVVITTGTSLSSRLRLAFEDEWRATGRELLREVEFKGDVAALAGFAELTGTAVFLAADAERARLLRPYLPNKLPLYATSQIFNGNEDTLTNYDLNGIRFVDMPWLLRADHPAVMIYPRAAPPMSADRERFYALGIDAFRLIHLMLDSRLNATLPLDGVSGDIQLGGHVFQRTPTAAILTQGHALLSTMRIEPAARMFPDQPAVQPAAQP